MIKENQRLLNQIHVISDAFIVFLSLPIAFWIRFSLLQGGIITVPIGNYIDLSFVLMLTHLLVYAMLGLYQFTRRSSMMREISLLFAGGVLNLIGLMSWLFINRDVHYSRLVLAFFFCLSFGGVGLKRVVLRYSLRYMRQHGYNQKQVMIIGGGDLAVSYLEAIREERELGYQPVGYVSSNQDGEKLGIPYLGSFDELEPLLEQYAPDEAISAIGLEDYEQTANIIAACEKTGTKLSIIPFYAKYMPSNPQFDEVNGIPLLNIRRIPLDNWANAFVKRSVDVLGSGLLLLVTSPIMLICALGVKLSSPGPIFFKQERVGLNKKPFYMYKFRSMKVNDGSTTAWSSNRDDRKTKFGSFIRKFSLDEFPQFFNVLKGDMSLVGPRPEIPFHVDHFKDEVPLYMVKHQVRPGITGWAQVNGFRGDTSIKGRIEHDVYYIEHWSLWFDIKILFMTVFKGKFVNEEVMR